MDNCQFLDAFFLHEPTYYIHNSQGQRELRLTQNIIHVQSSILKKIWILNPKPNTTIENQCSKTEVTSALRETGA